MCCLINQIKQLQIINLLTSSRGRCLFKGVDCINFEKLSILFDEKGLFLALYINTKLQLCISVSVKGFYKSQGVIEFVSETLQLSLHQLEDPKCQIDRWKLEKAIRGNKQVFVLLDH